MYLNYYNNKRFILIFLSLFILITCKKDEDSLAFVNASSSNDDFGYVEFKSGDYGIGSTTTFTAVANENYIFTQWEDQSTGQIYTDNPLTIQIDDNLNLVAEFEIKKFEFNLSVVGQGQITKEIVSTASKKSTEVESGSRIRLTGVPENDYAFFKWTGDLEGSTNPIEIDVVNSMDITGNFDFQLINNILGSWTFQSDIEQSAKSSDKNSSISDECNFFGIAFLPDYTFILYYSGGEIEGEFRLISNTQISLGNAGTIDEISISSDGNITFKINLTIGCSSSLTGEKDESDGTEITSFLEKVGGTYWKTSFTNSDGKELMKLFKFSDSIPESYINIMLVDKVENCLLSSFSSEDISELRKNYNDELSFFSNEYVDGENVNVKFTISTNQTLELSESYGLFGSTDDKASLLESITQNEYEEFLNYDSCGIDGLEPAPTPSHGASEVISIFSDSYESISGTNYNPDWNQQTIVTLFEITDGDSVLKYENLNYQGTEFDATSVVTKTHLHLDYFSYDATELKLSIVSPGPREKDQVLSLENKVLGKWMSADLELSSFSEIVDLCEIFQIKIEGNGTVYIDNIYFYGEGEAECKEKEPEMEPGEGPDGPAPTPTDDVSDVISIFGDTYTNISDVNMNPSWNQATQYTEVEIADGDKIVRYSNLNYQGIEFGETNVSDKSKLHIDYWTKDATELKLFLIGKTSSGGSTEKSVTIPVSGAGTWKNINIDLSEFNVVVDICKVFQIKIEGNGTVYFDNIYFYGTGSGECQSDAGSPASSAPTPDKDASEVISVYSNPYSDVSASTYSASWGNATFDGNFVIGSDNVLKYSALAFTGIEFASSFDISGKAFVHFDVWTPDNTTFNFKLVDYLSDGAWGNDNKEHEYTVSNLSQNQWTSFDIPLSEFTGLTSKGNIGQIVISAGPEGDRSMATVFIDNIYFYGTADTSDDSSGGSSDPAFTEGFGGATIADGVYTFPSGSDSWAGFANKNANLYPFSFPYGGQITFNAATQGTDVAMNFKFEKNPHPDVDPSFSTSNITISGTDVNQYSVDIPVRPDSQTYSSWLMYFVTQDAGVSITDIAITVYTELPASEDDSCSINTSLSSGSDSQSMNLGSAITDIVYDITTDCTQIIHLVESSGLPTGVTASIAGNTLTISGTPAGGSSGTYNYSLVIDNHLEETSSAPFVAATVSNVITGSITVVDLSTKLTLPINFEDESLVYDFSDFDGGNLTRVANPDASGINTSSYVGKMVKGVGETWAGSSYLLENAIDFSEKKFFTMNVRVPKASVQVLLKLESTSSNGNPIEVNATSTQVNTWETLIFDFSNVDIDGSYDKLVWIFENGNAGDGSDQFTYYVDNLFQKESASACSIEVSLETQGTNEQTVDYGSSIEDITYNLITDCIEIIHLVESSGFPTGVSATITGDTLTIIGTPASVSSGTYEYSIVIDNHLEETSTDPFRTATVSKVIEGSIIVNNEVTYTVEVPAGTQTVNFLSDLYNWDTNVTATDNGDGTWSRTVTPAPTSDVNYKWIVDGVQENLLAANAAGCDAFVQGTTFNTDGSSYANRLWKVGSGDQSGHYNGCDTANLTSVTFTVTVPGTHTSVHFNSSIWGWDPGQKVTATPSDTAGVYTHTISPAPSANIEYLWIVDDTQESLVSVAQAGCDALVQGTNINTDSNSYANRLWTVGSADQSGIYNACSEATLIFSDEFDGTGSIDDSKWHHQVIPPNNGTWHNNELQHYTDSDANSFISDGTLKIVAKKESYTYQNSTLDYTSARLNSKFVFKYGRVEVKAKTPAGGGTWPAIWTLGANINEVGNYHGDQYGNVGWPHCGELDIMEQYGDDKTITTSAIHWNEIEGGHVYDTDQTPISNVGSDFHVYSMRWNSSKIEFFVDDVKILEKVNDDSVPFDNEHYLLLNLAVGGQLGGEVPNDFPDQTFEIDYVRVYSY